MPIARSRSGRREPKAAQTSTLAQGATNLWDLTVRTSEYRSAAAVVTNVRRWQQSSQGRRLLPGLSAADPRAPALSIFVQALGGGTSSRLFQELREERGLAYSIYAWVQGFADTGLVGIGCAADRERAAESG